MDMITMSTKEIKRKEMMDSTAILLCMENELPILVLNLWDDDALINALNGKQVGTLVTM